MTDTLQAIPDMAEQTMDLLEKLLKERENNPEEILHLASRSDLVKLEIVYSKISFEILCCLKYMNIFHDEVLHASSYNQLCVKKYVIITNLLSACTQLDWYIVNS